MAKIIFIVNGVQIPYEGNLKPKESARPRTPHVDITGTLRFSESLEGSEVMIKCSVRNIGNNRSIMEQFYRTGVTADGTGSLIATTYDPSNPSKTTKNYDSGFLKDLPEKEDQELTEYEFCFRPTI